VIRNVQGIFIVLNRGTDAYNQDTYSILCGLDHDHRIPALVRRNRVENSSHDTLLEYVYSPNLLHTQGISSS
jgi:hypothetical protein